MVTNVKISHKAIFLCHHTFEWLLKEDYLLFTALFVMLNLKQVSEGRETYFQLTEIYLELL